MAGSGFGKDPMNEKLGISENVGLFEMTAPVGQRPDPAVLQRRQAVTEPCDLPGVRSSSYPCEAASRMAMSPTRSYGTGSASGNFTVEAPDRYGATAASYAASPSGTG